MAKLSGWRLQCETVSMFSTWKVSKTVNSRFVFVILTLILRKIKKKRRCEGATVYSCYINLYSY